MPLTSSSAPSRPSLSPSGAGPGDHGPGQPSPHSGRVSSSPEPPLMKWCRRQGLRASCLRSTEVGPWRLLGVPGLLTGRELLTWPPRSLPAQGLRLVWRQVFSAQHRAATCLLLRPLPAGAAAESPAVRLGCSEVPSFQHPRGSGSGQPPRKRQSPGWAPDSVRLGRYVCCDQ